MTVPVLTAVTDAVWEADLVSALERADLGVAVVRRCVDLADLLAAAAAGTARAAILSADLRRLDRDALARLSAARVAVVGLVPVGDDDAERRLRALGVAHVLPVDATPVVISAAVVEAVSRADPIGLGAPADPRGRSARPARPARADRATRHRHRPDRGGLGTHRCAGTDDGGGGPGHRAGRPGHRDPAR